MQAEILYCPWPMPLTGRRAIMIWPTGMTSPAMMRWGTWRNNSKLGVNHPLEQPISCSFFAMMIQITVDQQYSSSMSVWLVAGLGIFDAKLCHIARGKQPNLSYGTSGYGPVVVSETNLLWAVGFQNPRSMWSTFQVHCQHMPGNPWEGVAVQFQKTDW